MKAHSTKSYTKNELLQGVYKSKRKILGKREKKYSQGKINKMTMKKFILI
jgi:hypothetical protein